MRQVFLFLAIVGVSATALVGQQTRRCDADSAIYSTDPEARAGEQAALRERGPAALDELFAQREDLVQSRDATTDGDEWTRLNDRLARLDEAIDFVGGQRYCSASRLYWHTDFATAQAEAERTGKPILSLRMLGLLTDEFSCANSRFFRTTLYANEEISRTLREKFVLHWKSVRPVPRITIDFGDGRKIERTITGNSAHYVLAADGRVLDVLPGLYGPKAFGEWLTRVETLATAYNQGCSRSRYGTLTSYHRERAEQLAADWQADLTAAGIDAVQTAAELNDDAWRQIAALHADGATLDDASIQVIRAQNPNAGQAGRLTASKARQEDPLVKLVAALQSDIALDTVRNEHLLHLRIHERLAGDWDSSQDVEVLNEWVYADLFLTPSSDPWLGLVPDNTYTALPDNGVVDKGAE